MIRSGLLVIPSTILLFLAAGAPPRTDPATEKRFPPLKVPAGFKAILFACDPLIEYPSVISIGPKPGAIFVAIDYMTGLGTDGKVKSEIRLVEDTDGDGYADKATAFAKGFNSIQGMAYHDGTLYVMHAPFLTTLRDTKKVGVADERKDLLTGLGLKPEDNSSRLHCANGVVMGHDGWLYLALGDNGVNVPRPEGDRLSHNGGGILRCRPDGSDLHVFSTGLRNIYDIALDAELNVFTRDNENDGGTYMIRVCHSFCGADHGYPYLYYNRPDEALPPIGDFGLGSSAGGVCYLETHFPPAYRGNLLFCEWGKSVVRYELKRQGSGFAPVKELEFAAGDPKDTYPFKPTDIVVQRDGTLMVADYADGQRPKRGRGRIYHIVCVGQDSGPARKPKTIDSDSYYDRWEAQSLIERTGKKPVFQDLGSRGRLHAIWALARLDGVKAIDELLRIAKNDSDVGVRAQAVRAIADLADPILTKHKLDAGPGDAKIAEQLADLAKGENPRVQLEVVIALSRLRWTNAADWLRQNLSKPDATLAHAAMQTMRRSDNWPAVLKLLDQPLDTPIRRVAMRALTERWEPEVADGLIVRLGIETDAQRRRDYANALARVYKKPGPWKYWGYRPGPKPVNTVAWERTEAIEKSLDRALADADRDLRLAVLKRMQRERIPVRLARLGDWLKEDHHPERAAAIIKSLGLEPWSTPEPESYLLLVVLDKQHSVENRLQALKLVRLDTGLQSIAEKLEDGPVLAALLRRGGGFADKDVGPLLFRKVDSADAAVRAAAIEGLGRIGAKEGGKAVLSLLADKDLRVRRAAAGAAGKLAVKQAIAPLLEMLTDADPALRNACFDSLRLLGEQRALPAAVAALKDRETDLRALAYLHALGGPAHLNAVVDFAKQNPSSDVPAQVVEALLHWHDKAAKTDAERQALQRAVARVHGASGVLTFWRLPDPRPGSLKVVEEKLGVWKSLDGWKQAIATGAESDLLVQKAVAAEKLGGGVWFAATDLDVPEPTAVEFLGSSRGSLQVWLNGKSLYRRDQPRKFQLDSDRFAATLTKGNNRLLVETGSASNDIEVQRRDVEFHLRFRRKSAKAAHEKLTQAALTRTGNPERGRKVFFDKDKSQCMKCHNLDGVGERIGPDLSGVGRRFSRIYLVESILEPSRTIAPSFGTLAVTLKNGKNLNGVKFLETETSLMLADNQGQKHILAKADIDEQHPIAVSTMPEGLELRLSEDEFVDLIAFLASQK